MPSVQAAKEMAFWNYAVYAMPHAPVQPSIHHHPSISRSPIDMKIERPAANALGIAESK